MYRIRQTIKEYLRTLYIVDFEDGCRLISALVEYSNTHRPHSAIGYVTPVDKLNGRETLIVRQREDKLQAARQRREALRQATPANPLAAN
jgi:putative transposase